MSCRPVLKLITTLALVFCLFSVVEVGAQVVVLEKFPPNGSVQAGACGPFGVRLQQGSLTNYSDALVVRGSATGIRTQGKTRVSANGDSLYYTPSIPFASGEKVTITLRGSLASNGIALSTGITWNALIKPTPTAMTSDLGSMVAESISLSEFFAPGSLEFLGAQWSDLNADALQEGVLLLASGGANYLTTVAAVRRSESTAIDWVVRDPALCTADNPVDLCLVDLDTGHTRDVVLLALAGMQVWRNPGHAYSPSGDRAQWLAFPAGFNARAIATGDIDSDGDNDLVVFGLFGQQYLVYRNDGAGGLVSLGLRTGHTDPASTTSPTEKLLPWPIEVLLSDADSDGNLDLIWGADYQEDGKYPVRLAKGNGDGTFGDSDILTSSDTFAPGLFFGRILDPWDSADTQPVILVAGPDINGTVDNLCGVTFSGSWPGENAGCIFGPGLQPTAGTVNLNNFIHDTSGQVQYPELIYANPETGLLSVLSTETGQAVQTRETGAGAQAVFCGDFNYDGDSDLLLVKAQTSELLLLKSPGGNPASMPYPDGVGYGETINFGVREINCAVTDVPGHIPFTNTGLMPAIIDNVELNDSTGAFSLGTVPINYFSTGCLGPESTVLVPIHFAPTDTVQYTATITVTLTWVGAAAGEDSTVVSDFVLQGSGGINRLDDNGTGIGNLAWTSTSGYQTTGSFVDFGLLPALSGVNETTEVSLTNTGAFELEITPPTIDSQLWSLAPAGSQLIAAGQTRTWTLGVTPNPSLIPAGVDTFNATATLPWQVSSTRTNTCFPDQTITQDLGVRLLSVDPCLATDISCDGTNLVCSESEALLVMEGRPFSYCLRVMDWVWPGADPQLRIVNNEMDWLEISLDHENPELEPRISFTTDFVGVSGGTASIEVRDARHQIQVRTFSLDITVDPALADLSITSMWFTASTEDDISQQDPFYVDVVVECLRREADGVVLTLDGSQCSCDLGNSGPVVFDLAEGQIDTIRFNVDYCTDAGDCEFTACIEPAGGMVADYNPDDNCYSIGTMVRANRSPMIEFFNLSLDPPDPGLSSCEASEPWNEIIGNLVARLGVREGSSLTFSVRGVDVDGDARVLSVVDAPSFVSYQAVNDTLIHFVVSPPEGLVTLSVCQDYGPLSLMVRESDVVEAEQSTLDVPLFVKWEGPDLGVVLNDVPESAEMQDMVRFFGRVTATENAAGPFTVEIWLTDPTGARVAGRSAEITGLAADSGILIPQLSYTVERPGRYCAHIAVFGIRDVNPQNNTAVSCFNVAPGTLVVSPNVATPNGDGYNEYIQFHFANQTVAHPRVKVFELGGHQVYETDNLDAERRLSWNGRDENGRLVTPGTYLYVLYDDQKEFSKGTCGVIR